MPLYRVIAACCLWAAGTLGFATADAQARSEAIARAVDHCSSQDPNPPGRAGRLSEDRSILCFDGMIRRDLDLAPLHQLTNDGLFVVRSIGGDIFLAMKIADILWEKNATVVIRDYCLSACANAILIASNQTYVLTNAIVAWHGGTAADCADPPVVSALWYLNQRCAFVDPLRGFFTRRGIDPRHTVRPQTHFSRKMFDVALEGALEKRNLLWMWHPKNHRDHFKGRISYESYPDSRDVADAVMQRHFRGHIRVIYDDPEP